MANDENFAKFLGWFSIGLGVAEVAAARSFANLIGVRDEALSTSTLRVIGLREIGAGIGILRTRRPVGWLWARVAGDATDLALLGKALASDKTRRQRVAAASAAAVGVTVLDLVCGARLRGASRTAGKEKDTVKVNKSITINSSPEELYSFWHNFQNLPRFMRHMESVQVTGDSRSHWKAKAPAGKTVEWDAQVTEDRPNELISWRSIGDSDVQNAGTVRFVPAPGGRGTQVKVEMEYNPPGGAASAVVAKLFGEEPEKQVDEDLHAFKQVIETGEVTLSDGTLYDTHLIQRPAQPPQDAAAS